MRLVYFGGRLLLGWGFRVRFGVRVRVRVRVRMRVKFRVSVNWLGLVLGLVSVLELK